MKVELDARIVAYRDDDTGQITLFISVPSEEHPGQWMFQTRLDSYLDNQRHSWEWHGFGAIYEEFERKFDG